MQMGKLHCGEALVAAERNQMFLLRHSLPFCSAPLLTGWLFKWDNMDWLVDILISPINNTPNNPLCVPWFLLCLGIKILQWFTAMLINESRGSCCCSKARLIHPPRFWCVRLCILLHMGARVDVSTCGCMESRDQPCLSSPGAVHLGLVLWFVGSVREALWLAWSSPHRLGWFFSKPWESSILYVPRAGIRALTITLAWGLNVAPHAPPQQALCQLSYLSP